jgi:thiamine-monophosphate kinase
VRRSGAMNEFELIARFFTRPTAPGGLVRQGIGDDCALLALDAATQLAVTTDLLIAGRHFAVDAAPEELGHKALAVNLSDLAAAGAEPRCFLLALALPEADPAWLEAFSRGMFALADEFSCALAGGDTTRAPRQADRDGPVTICITAVGTVPAGAYRSRAGASAGEELWVSGTLGDAALALLDRSGGAALDMADRPLVHARLDRPSPRVSLGVALRGVATACVDVSDGLVGDIGHIVERSGVSATVLWQQVPRSPALQRQPRALQMRCALAGGDDYEIVFTAPASRRAAVLAAARRTGTPVARIGTIADGRDLSVLDEGGRPIDIPFRAYDHFGPYGPDP